MSYKYKLQLLSRSYANVKKYVLQHMIYLSRFDKIYCLFLIKRIPRGFCLGVSYILPSADGEISRVRDSGVKERKFDFRLLPEIKLV